MHVELSLIVIWRLHTPVLTSKSTAQHAPVDTSVRPAQDARQESKDVAESGVGVKMGITEVPQAVLK